MQEYHADPLFVPDYMPHADTSLIPGSITSKSDFWSHVHSQLLSLLDDQTSWVTNLSNTASLVYHALMAFDQFGTKDGQPAVNWCGFYVDSRLFPPNSSRPSHLNEGSERMLLLAPFCGKPACQFIRVKAQGSGVCADAYSQRRTLVVSDVDSYPGHIACDGDTKSEIVVPMILNATEESTGEKQNMVLGVMDLDSVVLDAFGPEDRAGLERIVQTVVTSCKWQ